MFSMLFFSKFRHPNSPSFAQQKRPRDRSARSAELAVVALESSVLGISSCRKYRIIRIYAASNVDRYWTG